MTESIPTVFKMYARGWTSMYGHNGRFITSMPLLIPLIPMSATFYTLSPSFLSLNHTSYPLNLSRLYPYFHYAHAYHVSTMPTSSLTPPYAHISPPMCVIILLSPIPVYPLPKYPTYPSLTCFSLYIITIPIPCSSLLAKTTLHTHKVHHLLLSTPNIFHFINHRKPFFSLF